MSSVLLTNIPTPYREKVFELTFKKLNGDFHVIFCSQLEPNRQWNFSYCDYSRQFLKPRFMTIHGHTIHMNTDVWRALTALDPEVVITSGINPTFLLAFFWSQMHNRPHVFFTDGWLKSEDNLSSFHRVIRKFIFKHSQAFIGGSHRSLDLFRSFNAPNNALFLSPLCVDNERYRAVEQTEKKYDVMFSGQFIERKMPLFFVEVVHLIQMIRGTCRVLVLGSGPLQTRFMAALKQKNIDFNFAGFVNPEDLPRFYASSRLLLFPTLRDPWGIVANEALAAGVPVITTPEAGAAGELIQNAINGYVLPPKKEIWAEHVVKLLDNTHLYREFSSKARETVATFTYEKAAGGMVKAVHYAKNSQ